MLSSQESRPFDGARDLSTAEKELQWFYADAAAAVGFHASGLESGGGGVFDEARSHRAHMTKRTWRHHRAAQMLRRIGPSVQQMSVADRSVVERAYTPHGWEPQMRQFFTIRGRGVCLAAIAMVSPFAKTCRDEYQVKAGGKREFSVAEYLESETLRALTSRSARASLVRIKADAQSQLSEALGSYDVIRMARVELDRVERQRTEYETKPWWAT